MADKIRLDEIKGSVEIGDDHLTILDEYGSEVVHWVVAEVEEDPEVAFTIAHAIKVFYEHGVDKLKEMIQ